MANGDDINEHISNNTDYAKYILSLKSVYKMNGNTSFKHLNIEYKRKVFEMYVIAIEMHVSEQLNNSEVN